MLPRELSRNTPKEAEPHIVLYPMILLCSSSRWYTAAPAAATRSEKIPPWGEWVGFACRQNLKGRLLRYEQIGLDGLPLRMRLERDNIPSMSM